MPSSALLIFSRNTSVVSGLAAVPSTAKLSESRPTQARLYNAGTSSRLVRSPDAPKTTMMQGSLSGLAFRDSSPGDPSIRAISVMALSSAGSLFELHRFVFEQRQKKYAISSLLGLV